MQDGHKKIVPIITSCSGREWVSNGRYALKDPMYIQGYGFPSRTLWENVYALCAEKYDLGRVEKIFVYGDGGSWIKGHRDVFPGAIYVLDGFHRERAVNALCRVLGGRYAKRLRAALDSGDEVAFRNALSEMEDDASNEGGMADTSKTIREEGRYLRNHFAAATVKDKDAIGSCTEAMVSHILSERLSRNPMGWSPAGLGTMASLRVYNANGRQVMPDMIGKRKDRDDESIRPRNMEAYTKLVARQQQDVLGGRKDWSIFAKDGDGFVSGDRNSGTCVAVSACGRLRKVS
jgi:hypothetical protein